VPLTKGVVDAAKREEIMLQLRMAQIGLGSERTRRRLRRKTNDNSHVIITDHVRFLSAINANEVKRGGVTQMDGVDADNEPLQAQILSQKRLATYYGEVKIGGQTFNGMFFFMNVYII
jgi:hypothetical protein